MAKETLTPRERWLAVLRREKPDRVPMDYWGTTETTRMLMKHLGCRNRWQVFKKLHIDFLYRVEPDYCGPRIPRNHDAFGCRYKPVRYGQGVYKECISHPLAAFQSADEIEKKFTWPDPDWWDYKVLPEKIKGKQDFPLAGGAFEPFLIYKKLRGEEQAFVDLIKNPEIVRFCLNKLFRLGYEEFNRTYEQIGEQIQISFISEDMGAQNDLMFSVFHIREFLIPHLKKMIDLAHQAGVHVFHHNDGSIQRIIPDMIDLGIDILNPIQWTCAGMERRQLKKRFGSRVIFHGAMDNQNTLPFGSTEDVRHEVIENLRILGQNGGFILAPCHNIQSITPIENILTLYRTGFEIGWVD